MDSSDYIFFNTLRDILKELVKINNNLKKVLGGQNENKEDQCKKEGEIPRNDTN